AARPVGSVAQTTLGVSPARPALRAKTSGTPASVASAPVHDKLNPLYVVLGAVAAIGLGVALALALVD
ncbi:MAG: hypothetical protein NT062_09840, partial [Proteobacteria bacterium]|nr:hypothetical protein [Pseudomonadota bacterium]